MTEAGLTTSALAPAGLFSAGGCTTRIRCWQRGAMPGVAHGCAIRRAAAHPQLAVIEPGLMIDRCVVVSMPAHAACL